MSLGLRAARGALWTILSSVGGRIIGLISTIILTRFLEKAEYGAVMVAITIVLTAEEFTQFGLFQYVIAKPKAGRDVAFHATFYHLTIGVAVLALVALLREPLGAYFIKDAEDLDGAAAAAAAAAVNGYILWTCVSSLFDRIAVAPERILARDMRFGTISIARGSSELVFAALAIALAIYGFGGYAIVYANIAQWALFMLWLALATSWRSWLQPTRITWDKTKQIWSFGLPLSVGVAASFAAHHWDKLLMARIFGAEAVGRYNLAYRLADIPATHIGEHIGDVLLPSFARMDRDTREDALERGTALLSLLVCPMAVGLMAVAPTLTAVLFDPRWAATAPMLAVLSALSVFRPIGWTIASYLQARDRPRWVMYLEVGKVVFLLGSILLLARLGELWACAAVGMAFGLHALLSVFAVKKLDGMPMLLIIKGLVGPLAACVPLAAAVYGVRHLLAMVDLEDTLVALVVEVAAGAIVFVPAAFLLAPFASRNLLGLIKKVVLRRGGDDDDDDGGGAGNGGNGGDGRDDDGDDDGGGAGNGGNGGDGRDDGGGRDDSDGRDDERSEP